MSRDSKKHSILTLHKLTLITNTISVLFNKKMHNLLLLAVGLNQ